MNWYKIAEGNTVTITPQKFQAKTYEGKVALAENPNLSPKTQLLFFTEEYSGDTGILQTLAQNRSISSQTQRMFFTEEYDYKHHVLWWLARNTSLSLQTQRLFFTEEYESKAFILSNLSWNTSFLKGLTSKEMREFTKTNKLPVYSKRLKQIKSLPL